MADYLSNPSLLRGFMRDPRSVYYYFNKFVRQPGLRAFCYRLLRVFVRKGKPAGADNAELIRLKKDGMMLWEQKLTPQKLASIREFLGGKPVFNLRDLSKTPISPAALAKYNEYAKLRYFAENVVQCEELVKLANDEQVIALVTAYLGCKPTISIMEAWWTKTPSEPSGVLFQDDMFHRDVEDFKFIKLFAYLNEVHEHNGAHGFIRGSHVSDKLTARGPISDAQAAQAFVAADHLVITGKAGCVFLEDTWGVHRAIPATTGERLLFSVTYSLTSFNPQSPKKPVGDNLFSVDAYSNRVYLK